MKSKSFNLAKNLADKEKQNKTFDFVNFYRSAAETSVKLLEKRKSDSGSGSKENVSNKVYTPKREHSPNKNKKKFKDNSMDISKINLDGHSLPYAIDNSYLNDSKVTSTPNLVKKERGAKVKSIIKNKSLLNETLNVSDDNISNKPKKRNKSVSFMLDDNEEIAIKKSKSEETVSYLGKPDPKSVLNKNKHKKSKKKSQDEKENKMGVTNMAFNIVSSENLETPSRSMKIEDISDNLRVINTDSEMNEKLEKRKHKKHNRIKPTEHTEVEQEICSNKTEQGEETKIKRNKKKKRHIKSVDIDKAQDEPVLKSFKKDLKPDKIVHELENLNIGDNAHTLTNLLDEMAVVDRNKKKMKKKSKEMDERNIDKQDNINNVPDNESENVKVKAKWDKRKWNKDKKGGVNADKYLTSVIVENLPFKIMCTYKKLLAEYFEKHGMIKQVGIAEMHPTENPKPVFSTTVNFYSEDAAEKALEEDNTLFEGSRIRVKKPLPPAETTLVVRSFAELSEQALSSVFNAAGRIRNIRFLVKGRKSNSTAFIEFDGPESVERAIKMAEDAKIGGKKIFVAKFEIRAKNDVKNYKSGYVKNSATTVKNLAEQEDSDSDS